MNDAHRVYTFYPPRPERGVRIVVVGTGGNGGWLLDGLAGLLLDLAECRQAGVAFRENALAPYPVELALVDPDVVEQRNLARQNFWLADVGHPKARALSDRYRRALGIESEFHTTVFRPDNPMHLPGTDLEILVGCGDNTAVRRLMHGALAARDGRGGPYSPYAPRPRRAILDLGNGRHTGQVLFGTTPDLPGLRRSFNPVGACTALPAPGLLRPDLLDPAHDTVPNENLARRDCAARVLAREQGLTINRHVAAHALTLLERLFLGELTYLGVYVNNEGGAIAQHVPLTPHAVAGALGRTPDDLDLYLSPRAR